VGSEIIDYHVNRALKADGTIKQQASDEISELSIEHVCQSMSVYLR